jgi:hypothetical protein
MAATDQPDVLSPDQLRPVDRAILSYLREGRVTPHYCRERVDDEKEEWGIEKDGKYSRGYIQQRLGKLVEHGHARNLRDTGLYELVDDPEVDDE